MYIYIIVINQVIKIRHLSLTICITKSYGTKFYQNTSLLSFDIYIFFIKVIGLDCYHELLFNLLCVDWIMSMLRNP